MIMKTPPPMRHALLALGALLLATSAHADTLRCGSSLISEGDAQGYVREKCGEPSSTMNVTQPVMARRPDGFAYQAGTTTQEIWRYKRGSGQFPAVLTFEGGVLKKLEFEK
jgi:hypothetical protein